jgi:hypothetical protein
LGDDLGDAAPQKPWSIIALIAILLMLALAAQAPFHPPPTPPGPSLPGSDLFDQERRAYEERLRGNCISEAGIAIIIEDWTRRRLSPSASAQSWRRLQQATAEAVYSRPVDMAALEAALREDAQHQGELARERAEAAIAVLRRLSAADRTISARDFTVMQPSIPVRSCLPSPRR